MNYHFQPEILKMHICGAADIYNQSIFLYYNAQFSDRDFIECRFAAQFLLKYFTANCKYP